MKVKPLHVIVVHDFAYVNGGAAKVAIDSAIALHHAGYKVTFFSAVGPVLPELQQSGINCVVLNQFDVLNDPNRLRAMIQGIWNFKAANVLTDMLKSNPGMETVVHIHSNVKALSASILPPCRKAGVPVVVTLHDYFSACPNGGFYDYQSHSVCTKHALSLDCMTRHCDVRNYAHKLWRVVRSLVFNHVGGLPNRIAHFIYISKLSKSLLTPYLPQKSKCHFVPNPIDVIKQPRIPVEQNEQFYFIGRLSAEKGIEAFCQVVETLQCPATVIGDSDSKTNLKKHYPSLQFTGWLQKTELALSLLEARALVFPSLWYETQGLVVYEALARGIPVIVPEQCSAAEAVQHQYNGLLYDGSQGGLQNAVQQIMTLPVSKIQEMSVAAYQSYWEKAVTMDKHIEQLTDVYEQLST